MKTQVKIELGEIRNRADEQPLSASFIRKSQEESKKQLQKIDWDKAIEEAKNYYGNHKDKRVRAMLEGQLAFINEARKFAGERIRP